MSILKQVMLLLIMENYLNSIPTKRSLGTQIGLSVVIKLMPEVAPHSQLQLLTAAILIPNSVFSSIVILTKLVPLDSHPLLILMALTQA